MNPERDALAAAHARITELEGELARREGAPNMEALEREHAALVRSVPAQARVRAMTALAALISLLTLGSMLFLSSPYDQHPRFSIAMEVLVICSSVFSAAATWVARAEGLRRVALSERLVTAERARVALESRIRIADAPPIAESAEPLPEPASTHARRA